MYALLAATCLGLLPQSSPSAAQSLPTPTASQAVALEEALRLSRLAVEKRRQRRLEEAVEIARQVLAIRESILGPEHLDTALSLNDLAVVHQDMGRYEQALPLHERALAVRERAAGPEHRLTAQSLGNLSALYEMTGRYEQALQAGERALAIREAVLGPEHIETSYSLSNLAVLHLAMGRYEPGLSLAQRALEIRRKVLGREHVATGTTLNNLANLYKAMGRYEEALPYLQQALMIRERSMGPEHPGTASALGNLASLYRVLGRHELAVPLYERALAIRERALGLEHPDTATTLHNFATLYWAMGRFEDSLTLYRRALAIRQKALGPDHSDTAATLHNMAVLHRDSGQLDLAIQFGKQALAIKEKSLGNEHPDTANSLNNLAVLFSATGRQDLALAAWDRALPVALRGDLPELAFRVQDRLREALASTDPATAIYWGKRSVNAIQSMRTSLVGLDRETQEGFLRDKRKVYTGLSDLLIAQGRLIEAQRVMALLKEEEFFELIRRDEKDDPRQARLPLTGVEEAAAQRMEVIRSRLGSLFVEQQRLRELQLRGGLDEADRQRLAAIGADVSMARKAFDGFVASLSQQLASQGGERSAAVGRIESHQNLLENLGESGRGVAAVQYVTASEQLSIIVSTTAGQSASQVKIREADLNQKIAEFRNAVQDPASDPRPLGRALARLLLDPIEPTLRQQGVHTLLLMLDGALRYLPFAAMLGQDERYLVERYQMAVYTEAAATSLVVPPRSRWQVAALGVTRGFPQQGFEALPAVAAELDAIVNPAVLPGTRHLDEAFNLERFKASLGQPVLHIASHFRFVPGSDESFLLLGDGTGLSLRQLRTELPRLTGVELLTLSACQTAVGGGIKADGREVEGLGVLAQKRGAMAVMASLWPVADESTGELMAQFYRQRQAYSLNKAQALRRAQLALLRGHAADPPNAPVVDSAPRFSAPGLTTITPNASHPNLPYAHPFHWAPFILMGNWL